MRTVAILCAFVSSVLVMGQGGAKPDKMGGFGPGSGYNRLWNSSTVITFNGKVTGKLVVPPVEGMMDAVTLLVKQPDRDAFEVQLGPYWYVSQMPTKINAGDEVTVTGSRVKLNGRTIVLAQTVQLKRRELVFRDKSGNPVWVTFKVRVQPQGDPSASGEIVDTSTVDIDGTTYNVYRVDTGSGTLDIVGEPTWLANRQPVGFHIGNNVQIFGLRPPTQIGRNLYLADGFYAGGTMVIIRPPWGF